MQAVNFEALLSKDHTKDDVNISELEVVEESFITLQNHFDDWLWSMDSMIGGAFGVVSKWLSEAEKWIKCTNCQWFEHFDGSVSVVFCGAVSENLSCSDIEPKNSPSSIELIQTLIDENTVGFNVNNFKLFLKK